MTVDLRLVGLLTSVGGKKEGRRGRVRLLKQLFFFIYIYLRRRESGLTGLHR